MAIIEECTALLGIEAPLSMSSEDKVSGSRSALLAQLCQAHRASTYISGPSGRDYLELAPFRERGIEVEVFEFSHPRYSQPGPCFVPNLGIVDLIACVGADGAQNVLAEAVEASRCVSLDVR